MNLQPTGGKTTWGILSLGLVLGLSFWLRSGVEDLRAEGREPRPEPIPVLLVTGQNNHDCAFTSKKIEEFLEGTSLFDVTITENPARDLAKEGELAKYRAIFLDYNGKRWGDAAEKAFVKAVEGGVGVVIMHAANNAFPGWVEYEKICGLVWRNGKTGHGKFHPFDVDVVDRNHPITWGLPSFKAHPDELYHNMVHMHGVKYRTLMDAYSSKESGGTGKREPMAMILEYGKGRVFHTALGHVWPNAEVTRKSLEDEQLQRLLIRGTQWAATGQVTPLIVVPEGENVRAQRKPKRAHDPWVFRCVLDGKPRVAVAALDERMWVAYDLAQPGLYKVWVDGVKLVGSVYDAAHGPQPQTKGAPLAVVKESKWSIVDDDGGSTKVRPRYEGYRFSQEDDLAKVTFRYRISRDGKPDIVVDEQPEARPMLPRLLRRFDVKGLRPGERLRLVESGDLPIKNLTSTTATGVVMEVSDDKTSSLTMGNGVTPVYFRFALKGGL